MMFTDTFTLNTPSTEHGTLAGIDVQKLRNMRDAGLRSCFNHLEETPYRLQFVARVRGREYYNDAASRTVNSTWYSLERTKGGIIWIADASESENDYSRLLPLALRKVRMLIVVGQGGDLLKRTFKGIIPTIVQCQDMAEALKLAYWHNVEDDLRVLYSPACSSSTPTSQLGDQFRRQVNEL